MPDEGGGQLERVGGAQWVNGEKAARALAKPSGRRDHVDVFHQSC